MKIWFFEIGEPLPQEENARLHRYGLFSRFLAKHENEVTIWTSTFSHAPKIHVANQDLTETFDKVQYKFIHGLGYKKNISLGRINHNKDFAKKLSSILNSLSENELPDVIFAPIPIIEVANIVTLFAERHSIRTIVDVRDEWPDEIVNIAPAPLRPIARLFFRASYRSVRETCNRASAITGVSQRQVDYGLRFTDKHVDSFAFPLGYPEKISSAESIAHEVAQLKDQFDFSQYDLNCCFFGTMGRFFELENILHIAKAMPHIGFILAGQGVERDRILPIANSLPNVYMPGWVNQEQIQAVMKISDIGLAPYKKSEAFSLPNKPFEYMSGGLALLSSVQGELKQLIAEESIGRTIDDTSLELLQSALVEMSQDSEKLQSMKDNARKLYEQRFASETIFAAVLKRLQDLVSHN